MKRLLFSGKLSLSLLGLGLWSGAFSAIRLVTRILALVALLGMNLGGKAHAQLYVGTGTQVAEYDATTGLPINANLISGTDNPMNIVVSGSNLFAINRDENTVSKYDATTGAVINANFITGLDYPVNLAIFGNDLFVANYHSYAVGEYDATTGATINANFITMNSQGTGGLSISGTDLYVTNDVTKTLGEYNAITGAAIDASLATGIVSDSIVISGNTLFVASPGVFVGASNKVSTYNVTTGAPINANFISGLSNIGYIALSSDGHHLFVENRSTDYTTGSVGVYDATTGAAINTHLVTGVSYPGSIAVATVPEPSTFALLAVGAVAVAGYVWRRRSCARN